MKLQPKRIVFSAAVLALAALLGGPPATAAEDVTVSDLQAMTRSLGFLDTLRRDGTIAIGVVYAPNVPNARMLAARAAESLRAIPGPNSAALRPEIIAVEELAQFPGRLDAVFLMPGVSAPEHGMADTVRRRRLVSISNDPACLDAKCCVLMVGTTGSVEIVLDTAQADAVGAHFSSVFVMMVKRR
jgi:hypothetical protein